MSQTAAWMSAKDFALSVSLSRYAVYRLVKERRIPSIRIGGTIRIPSLDHPHWDPYRGHNHAFKAS